MPLGLFRSQQGNILFLLDVSIKNFLGKQNFGAQEKLAEAMFLNA